MSHITRISIKDYFATRFATRAIHGAKKVRIRNDNYGAWWSEDGNGYATRESDAWVTTLDKALTAVGALDAYSQSLIYLEFIDSPDPVPADVPVPSTSSPTQSNTEDSSHSQTSLRQKVGSGVQLYAAILPVFDLLSGSASTHSIVLELSAHQFGFGVRKTQTNWHGPFATESEAKGFVSQLAKSPPTQSLAPSAN